MRSVVALLVTTLCAAVMAASVWLPGGQAEECSFHYSYRRARQGTFSSPGYPEKYPAQVSCFYRFQATANGGVQIKFEFFNLEGYSEKEHQCVFDYIDVYAEDYLGYRVVLGRFCGNKTPAPIISPRSTLLIEFVSDYTKPSRGFLGHYTFLGDKWQPFEHDTQYCGPSYVVGSGGLIHSPRYPLPFPLHRSCSWLIKVHSKEQILLMIDDLDMGTSARCGSSGPSLQIYYGYATNNTVPSEELCGQMNSVTESRKRELLSPKPRVIIRFVSGIQNHTSRGFRLSWTAIHLPHEEPCPEFQCEGGFACGIEGLGGICDKLPRYCIHHDQRCNGIANCGQRDDSDERRCPREIIIMTALIVVPSLAVLALVIGVYCYCFRSKRLNKSASQNQPLTSAQKHGSSKESFNSHRSYQQCSMMHTSFVDVGGPGTGAGTMGRNSATPSSRGGGGAIATGTYSGSCGGGDGGLAGVRGGGTSMSTPSLPGMEETHAEIDEQQLQIPVPRGPDPNYRTHQKRASYTMMKQSFEEGNSVIAEI